MKLLYSRDDYCLLKVKLVAALTETPLELQSTTQDELAAKDGAAKSLLLEVDGQCVGQHLAVLRYLAETSKLAAQLLLEDVERAQVNQWLEFSWEELGE